MRHIFDLQFPYWVSFSPFAGQPANQRQWVWVVYQVTGTPACSVVRATPWATPWDPHPPSPDCIIPATDPRVSILLIPVLFLPLRLLFKQVPLVTLPKTWRSCRSVVAKANCPTFNRCSATPPPRFFRSSRNNNRRLDQIPPIKSPPQTAVAGNINRSPRLSTRIRAVWTVVLDRLWPADTRFRPVLTRHPNTPRLPVSIRVSHMYICIYVYTMRGSLLLGLVISSVRFGRLTDSSGDCFVSGKGKIIKLGCVRTLDQAAMPFGILWKKDDLGLHVSIYLCKSLQLMMQWHYVVIYAVCYFKRSLKRTTRTRIVTMGMQWNEWSVLRE